MLSFSSIEGDEAADRRKEKKGVVGLILGIASTFAVCRN
jgi:hypothetical protein